MRSGSPSSPASAVQPGRRHRAGWPWPFRRRPSRRLHGPPALAAQAGVILMAPAGLWFVAFRPRSPPWLGVDWPAPGVGQRTLCLLAAVADWLFSAAVLYILMPTRAWRLSRHSWRCSCSARWSAASPGRRVGSACSRPWCWGSHRSRRSCRRRRRRCCFTADLLPGPDLLVVAVLGLRQLIDLTRAGRANAAP